MSRPFSFISGGRTLVGVLDYPETDQPRGAVVIIHGGGRTDVVAGNGGGYERELFTGLGFVCCAWDKIGCGKSEGRYAERSVRESAEEALLAIGELRRLGIPGADRVGLWGMSRAGWICPLVIGEDPSISFWISVSGTGERENFPYMLSSNLRLAGRSDVEAARLADEWAKGARAFLSGAPASEYLSLTKGLRADPFYRKRFGPCGEIPIRLLYRAYQRRMTREQAVFDEATGLQVYVPGFGRLLEGIRCPVLAIFGEKDRVVDWRETKALYEGSLGKRGSLTVRTFPDGDHLLFECGTGAIGERIAERKRCPGYREAIASWLGAPATFTNPS